MTRQVVTTTPHNSGLGDPAYTAFEKLNANEAELYAAAGVTGASALSAATYTIARTLTGTTTGDRLQVLGRTSQSDGGQGLFTWVAGGTTTVDEGYVLQATGGTWQRQDPSPTVGETLLNAVWFNIKPTNADTVNDTGFAKLKAQMQTSGTTMWRVFFPPGAYMYTNNRWLFGVQLVIIEAYGCTFQCTNVDGSYVNGIPLNSNDFFQDWGDVAWPGNGAYASGYLFNTAAAGAISITTTTASDAGNFTPGMRIVLMGYDQQGSGYPPNLRYFEYKTVLTAVAGTGVVTFTNPVAYAYDSRWWDTANYGGSTGLSAGAPRILSLERANYKQAKLLWIKGANFLANPTTPADCLLQVAADLVLVEDVQSVGFNFAEADRVLISRGTFPGNGASSGQSAGDKLLNRLVVSDSVLGTSGYTSALADCNGVNSLSLVRTTLYGNINPIAPRNLLVSDSDIVPVTGTFAGIGTATNNPVRNVAIGSLQIKNTGGLSYGFVNQASPGLSLTVGSVVGTDIRISFDATGKAVAYSIEYGMTLTNTTTGNTGIITAIFYETGSPGTLRISGTWSAPSGGDVFHYYDVMQAADLGGNRIIGTQVPFWRTPPGPSFQDSAINNLTFATALINSLKPNNQIQAKSYGFQVVDENSNNVGYFGGFAFNVQAGAVINFATGAGIQYGEGANGLQGEATLSGGTVVVSTTKATANSRIFLSRKTAGGTLGNLTFTISNGTSFTINSSSGTDTSTVDWLIMNHQ